MMRQHHASGAVWESIVGYSRAVRIGQSIEVSGTVAVDARGQVVGPGDPAVQTRRVLEIITEAIIALGGRPTDIIRTRIYVTDIAHWEAIGRVHGEFFRDIRPATSMVEVSRLIGSDYLVEIEASAILSEPVA